MWNVEAICGYKPFTTFWDDFSIAEKFGKDAIKDTFDRVFAEWKTDYKYLTELVMVLNHKLWYWYGKDNDFARMYHDFWNLADEYAVENLNGDELDYFYTTTD